MFLTSMISMKMMTMTTIIIFKDYNNNNDDDKFAAATTTSRSGELSSGWTLYVGHGSTSSGV